MKVTELNLYATVDGHQVMSQIQTRRLPFFDQRVKFWVLFQFSITIGILFINGLAINDAVHWPIITGINIAFPGNIALLRFEPFTPCIIIGFGSALACNLLEQP